MYHIKKNNKGFTLTEVLFSSFIFVFVITVTISTFLALSKQTKLAEATADVSLQLHSATRNIYNVIVSSPGAPQLFTDTGATTAATLSTSTYSGLCFRIAVPQNHYIMVDGGLDTLDAATGIKGYKYSQKTISFSTTDPQATTHKLLKDGATCPSAYVTTLDTSIFNPDLINGTGTVALTPGDFFAPNDKVSIPATGFGGATQLTITGTGVGSTSITFTTQLNTITSWGLPNGTLLTATKPTMSRICVVTTASSPLKVGDLVYYPDDSDLTKYTVLAHNILSQTIYIDPSNQTSGGQDAYPFIYNVTTQELVVNLQCLPPGNPISGRAIAGDRMRILIRTPISKQDINSI